MSQISRRRALFLCLLFAVSGCSPARFFFIPTPYLYSDPATKGLKYESIDIRRKDGKILKAILFESDSPPKGTVVHCHGNFGNVSCHYMATQFLTRYGFDVIVFDYQGYGGSDGHPSQKGAVEDSITAFRYAQDHLRPGAAGVVVFGQSLGGAIATAAVAKEPLVKAVVLESAFYSYNSQARDVLKRSIITWILYPFYPPLLGRTYNPSRWVDKISPRPILFIHGTADQVVPVWMTKKLFQKAKEPKRLWIIEGANHMECHYRKGKEYEQTVAQFFSDALQK